jgi:hypothetical protein
MADGISIREFARREHVSHTLVVQAIKQGRLSRLVDGSMDVALLGTGWRTRDGASGKSGGKLGGKSGGKLPAQTFHSGGNGKGLAYGEALRLKENWLALLRRLDYEQRSGTLVEIAVAQRVVFELCREQRDAWLAWPSKIAPYLAVEFGITDVERLTALLAAHVNQQLGELGEPAPRFDAAAA